MNLGTRPVLAHSGLIVFPKYRGNGLAKIIKKNIRVFKSYPEAKIFGITTGKAVKKINSDWGINPFTFRNLTIWILEGMSKL